MATLTEYYKYVVDKWYSGSSRKFIEYAISTIEREMSRKNIFVIEAPTGYGKSAISATLSLYSVYEEFKSIIAFPLRTLLEDQYSGFLKLVPRELIGKRYMHTAESPYLIHPITLTTIDTLSLTVFGIAPEDLNKVMKKYFKLGTSTGSMGHYWYSWGSVGLSNIVLDEVHLVADSTKSINFLATLMDFVIRHDGKLVLMSATLPKALKETLLNIAKFPEKMEIIEFSSREGYDEEFVSERRKKKYNVQLAPLSSEEKFEAIESWILSNKGKYDKVIVIFNTVNDAIEFYSRIVNNKDFAEYLKVLLHSRFTEEDRKYRFNRLKEASKKEKYIVVTTQTIEAGVNVSSTLMISEIAPANSLIQRFGRFLRYNEIKGRAYIWFEVDEKGNVKCDEKGRHYKVYDCSLVRKTLQYLKKHGNLNFHVPQEYSSFLNEVYCREDFNVDFKTVTRMINIFLSYDYAPKKAVDEFLRLEGSFVREGLILPTIPNSYLEGKCIEDIVAVRRSDLEKNIVPLQYSVLKKYFDNKIITLENGVFKIENVNDKWDVIDNPKKLLMFFYRRGNVLAFVVKGNYNSLLGLRLKEE